MFFDNIHSNLLPSKKFGLVLNLKSKLYKNADRQNAPVWIQLQQEQKLKTKDNGGKRKKWKQRN